MISIFSLQDSLIYIVAYNLLSVIVLLLWDILCFISIYIFVVYKVDSSKEFWDRLLVKNSLVWIVENVGKPTCPKFENIPEMEKVIFRRVGKFPKGNSNIELTNHPCLRYRATSLSTQHRRTLVEAGIDWWVPVITSRMFSLDTCIQGDLT